MKKIFKIGLFSLAFSLCVGTGAISFKDNKPATKVEAAGEAWQATNFPSTYYATSKDALNQKEASTPRSIKLLRDTTETDCSIWLTTATVTIDLNGHTLNVGDSEHLVPWFVAFGAGGVTEKLNLTIKSSVAGGKINAYCTNAVLFLDPTQTADSSTYTCTANIQSGVQIKNFSTGRTIYMHKSTTLNVNDGASIIATYASQPAITCNGGTINNNGTIQGHTDGVLLEPVTIDSVLTTPSIKLSGSNAVVTPRIRSKRSGGITLANYSYSENNASVQPVNVAYDESSVVLTDNLNVFSNIHWKYKDNFDNYITISAAGSNHHTLSWEQQVYNQTGYLRWVRNSYTITYNINGGKSGTTLSQSFEAERYVPLRENGFVPQDYHRFVRWDTRADGAGEHYLPEASYHLVGNVTLYAIWESVVIPTVQNIETRSSLAYHYSKSDLGNFTFTNLYVRFGGIISQSLWNALNSESVILGYGELYSTDEYLGTNHLKDYYATANTNPNVEIRSYEVNSNPESKPVLFNDSNYQGVTDDYYVWNLRTSVEATDYETVYASVAFIITQDDNVIFFEETRKSVKSLAQDLIDGPDYDNESLDGSLAYLASL